MAERKRVAATADKNSEMDNLMRDFYIANKQCNAAKAKADKARKELYKMMKAANKETYIATVINSDGLPLPLIASIETPEKNEVDINKLRKLIGEDMFMRCVSASQASVKDIAGENILNLSLVKTTGTENVKVDIKK